MFAEIVAVTLLVAFVAWALWGTRSASRTRVDEVDQETATRESIEEPPGDYDEIIRKLGEDARRCTEADLEETLTLRGLMPVTRQLDPTTLWLLRGIRSGMEDFLRRWIPRGVATDLALKPIVAGYAVGRCLLGSHNGAIT